MKTWHTILGATAVSVLGALAIVRGPQWFGPASSNPQGKPPGQAANAAGTPPPWLVTAHPG